MIGLSINESTRTAALDGALSFSILLQNQRELTLSSANSSVTGLLSAIRSAPANYGPLLTLASDALAAQNSSAIKLNQPAWADTDAATRTALRDALNQSFATLVNAARALANSAATDATAAKNASANPSTERTLAADLENAGNLLLTALAQLDSNNDALAAQNLATARAQINTAHQDAQTHLTALQSQNPQPAGRIADTQAVIAAAQSLLTATNSADSAAASPLAGPAGETPTSYQLTGDNAPSSYLTVWGDSGAISLTDANGQGILISHDGKVDTLPPGGDGWQFQTASTFLLPDGTKISITPGTPASVLATRGQQRIAINNLEPGQNPNSARHQSGGLIADAARNDGHIFSLSGNPSSWTLAGSPLGDTPGSREVVATTPLTNEQPVDVTLTSIPPALLATLQQVLGLDINTFDLNQDGKLNTTEWQSLVSVLDSAIAATQSQFDQSLGNTTAALQSLLSLNQFIEKILDESDRRQADRQQVNGEERNKLLQIQRDLASALTTLRSADPIPAAPAPANVLATAKVVLNQLDSFGVETPPEPPAPQNVGGALRPDSAPAPDTVTLNSAVVPPVVPPLTESPTPTDTLAQSFRRAERLLSGLSGGIPNLRFTEPPAPAETARLNVTTPPTVSEALSPDSVPPVPPTALSAEPPPINNASATPIPVSIPVTPQLTETPILPVAPIIPLALRRVSETPAPDNQPLAPPLDDPAVFTREYTRRFDQHRSAYHDLISRAQALQSSVRQVVEQFLTLVGKDDDLRQVFTASDLSDTQRDALKDKVVTLERELGITWGGDPDKTPQGEANLNTRMLSSGMKI